MPSMTVAAVVAPARYFLPRLLVAPNFCAADNGLCLALGRVCPLVTHQYIVEPGWLGG